MVGFVGCLCCVALFGWCSVAVFWDCLSLLVGVNLLWLFMGFGWVCLV